MRRKVKQIEPEEPEVKHDPTEVMHDEAPATEWADGEMTDEQLAEIQNKLARMQRKLGRRRSAHVRQRDSRSEKVQESLKALAKAKRARRCQRNLNAVARASLHQAAWNAVRPAAHPVKRNPKARVR